ncbi:MAG: hypothetical protein C4529_08880 [Deltaproteobacteria bacterium]|nr:MAG: hypothetical protein C4529_08880 [Deltaproteobacteria bacterium]
MRDLKKTDRNRVVLLDLQGGSKIGLFYATPTTSQVKGFHKESLRRKGNKVMVDSFDPALKYGLEVITGFDEGAFGYDGVPISADPAHPNYREDWKELLSETASDIVITLGRLVFEGVRPEQSSADILVGEEEEAESAVPLALS